MKSCREVEPKETEYFGMRPWRVGLKGTGISESFISIEVRLVVENEPASEEEQSEGFFVLQAKELLTDYCVSLMDFHSPNHFMTLR